MKFKKGEWVKIPVASLEFVVGQKVIWVHSPVGATVLRIKLANPIGVVSCRENPVSHLDLNTVVDPKVVFCLAGYAY